jgi:hypothetical protein
LRWHIEWPLYPKANDRSGTLCDFTAPIWQSGSCHNRRRRQRRKSTIARTVSRCRARFADATKAERQPLVYPTLAVHRGSHPQAGAEADTWTACPRPYLAAHVSKMQGYSSIHRLGQKDHGNRTHQHHWHPTQRPDRKDPRVTGVSLTTMPKRNACALSTPR